jgi:hypothetical protein
MKKNKNKNSRLSILSWRAMKGRLCSTGSQITWFTSTKVHILCWRMLTYADVCWRMLTYADVCWRMLDRFSDYLIQQYKSTFTATELLLVGKALLDRFSDYLLYQYKSTHTELQQLQQSQGKALIDLVVTCRAKPSLLGRAKLGRAKPSLLDLVVTCRAEPSLHRTSA